MTVEINSADRDIYAFDSASSLRPYAWLSKLYQLPFPMSFGIMQVKAFDYDDLTITLYADGVSYYTKVVTSSREFVIPQRVMRTFEVKAEGTSRITMIEVAQDVMELT